MHDIKPNKWQKKIKNDLTGEEGNAGNYDFIDVLHQESSNHGFTTLILKINLKYLNFLKLSR